ncbi:sulfotransferase [Undibacterium sp. Di27W]|uniref:sulfotransferase n=1 Tax=Undibacterium sp. Di27W TaxID=3413036 RepID=UPI003BF3CAAD
MTGQPGFAAEERALQRAQHIDARHLPSMLGWFPVAISAEQASVCWRHLGEIRFIESFFLDTLNQQSREQRQLCLTPLVSLSEQLAGMPCVAPTAFIFHVSRCGSTLLTQMLASLPQCMVMSEPPVMDAFFRYYHAHPDMPDAIATFRHLISALGQQRHQEESHFFIKFDSWHLAWLPFVREAYPDIPIIFLYREPQAVLASHQRQRGPQMIPGLLNTTRLQATNLPASAADFNAYTASILACMLEAGFEHTISARLILLNYSQLPDVLWNELLALFQLDCNAQELLTLKARSALHSKHRHLGFSGDPELKSREMGGAELPSLQYCDQIYAQLESLRLKVKICKVAQ